LIKDNQRYTEPVQERTSGYYNKPTSNSNKNKEIDVNNLLGGIDGSYISEEEGNISEGNAGSNFLDSFENENKYFDKNKIAIMNPMEVEVQKNVHHFPRESNNSFIKFFHVTFIKKINFFTRKNEEYEGKR